MRLASLVAAIRQRVRCFKSRPPRRLYSLHARLLRGLWSSVLHRVRGWKVLARWSECMLNLPLRLRLRRNKRAVRRRLVQQRRYRWLRELREGPQLPWRNRQKPVFSWVVAGLHVAINMQGVSRGEVPERRWPRRVHRLPGWVLLPGEDHGPHRVRQRGIILPRQHGANYFR